MSENVVAFPTPSVPPDRKELTERCRRLAQNTANIHFHHPHFQERMRERGLTMRQVLETVRNGGAVDGPMLDQYGDWRIKLRRKVAGRRVQVVVAVKEFHLVIVTAI